MNDKQRAEFEKWAREEGFDTERHNDMNQEIMDWYACGQTDMAWKVWQAAIASVTVELPTLIIDEYDNGDTLEYVEMSELKDALNGAGVKYK